VGVGLVAGGGPMARLPRLIGRNRALEVLLSSNDIGGDLAEAYGYVNRSLPDAELDGFVDALATRIASFDKWAIANTKRLVNAASLPRTSKSPPGGTPAWLRLSGRRRKTESRPCSSGAFINPETQKIGSDPTWGDLAPEGMPGPAAPRRRCA
jgi:Enoyl-CoA hydratase/isomerase